MWWVVGALAAPCAEVRLEELLDQPSPSVFVLGERHGDRGDLRRALSLVEGLSGPVTLAMEAVHESNQAEVQDVGRGLRRRLRWKKTWGFRFGPYKRLIRSGAEVVAAGLDLGPKPEDREVVIPEGYRERLDEMMKDHELSDEVRARFATSMTWRDFRIAELSAQGWNGKGFLVVLVGRGHVEGGMGTNWQLRRLVDAPVVSVILNAAEAECAEGEAVWVE